MNPSLSHCWISVLALVAGCSFSAASEGVVANRCTSDDECAGPGARCSLEIGMCVSVVDEPLFVAIQVAPATDPFGSGDPIPFVVPPLEVRGETTRDLSVPLPVNIFGTVRSFAGGVPQPVPAEIRFVPRDSLFTGGSATVVTSVTRSVTYSGPDMAETDYEAFLLPAIHEGAAPPLYDVVVSPIGEHAAQLPPLRLESALSVGAAMDPTELRAFRFDLAWPEDLAEIRGQVSKADGMAAANLQVRAIDAESGALVSSIATTGPEGEFTIRMLPAMELSAGWLLQISAGPEEPLFPTFTVNPDYLYPDPDTGVVPILVPAVGGAVRYRGSVEDFEFVGETVPGALITLRSSDVTDTSTGVVGTFSTSATTDGAGFFEVDLLPGTYEVVIAPPSESALAVYVESGIVVRGESVMGQTFRLLHRATYGGRVQTSDLRDMPGASVEARPLGVLDGVMDPAARFNRSNDAVTDATGQFTFGLDVGLYDVVVRPPADTGFAWIVDADVSVEAAARNHRRDYTFEAPLPLMGTLQYQNGLVIAGADVQAFAIVMSTSGPRAVPIAATLSDADGRYTLLLPPRIRIGLGI